MLGSLMSILVSLKVSFVSFFSHFFLESQMSKRSDD